jgi:hypothetical protein
VISSRIANLDEGVTIMEETKEMLICGQGRSKSMLASLLALSAGNPYVYDDFLFPKVKPIRDVPEHMPKKEQGRNEKCHCGSGLKYKKCCGK